MLEISYNTVPKTYTLTYSQYKLYTDCKNALNLKIGNYQWEDMLGVSDWVEDLVYHAIDLEIENKELKSQNQKPSIQSQVDYYKSLPWSFNFKYDNKDKIYVASIKELKSCKSHGKNVMEAANNVVEALELWIKTALENNIKIPVPNKTKLENQQLEAKIKELDYVFDDRFGDCELSFDDYFTIKLGIEDLKQQILHLQSQLQTKGANFEQ